MSQPTPKVQWAVWGGLGLVVLGIVGAFIASQFKPKPLPVWSLMPSFTLTNQDSQPVTLETLRGSVWIADAIFTRCPGQCLLMSGHMKEIQNKLPSDQSIKLVSCTTDPAFDSPAILKKYAEKFSTRNGGWLFLTGTKPMLHSVEIDGLKLSVLDKAAAERESPNDLFIHSEKFVLLDKQGRVRAWFDGEQAETIPQILAAAETLAKE